MNVQMKSPFIRNMFQQAISSHIPTANMFCLQWTLIKDFDIEFVDWSFIRTNRP